MVKSKDRTRQVYVDEKKRKLVEKGIKIVKLASYVLAAGVAGYGAWWLSIPGGEDIGISLIIAGLLISAFATFELRKKRWE